MYNKINKIAVKVFIHVCPNKLIKYHNNCKSVFNYTKNNTKNTEVQNNNIIL